MIDFAYEFDRISKCNEDLGYKLSKIEKRIRYPEIIREKADDLMGRLYSWINEEQINSKGLLNPEEAIIAYNQLRKTSDSMQKEFARDLEGLCMYLKSFVSKLSAQYREILGNYLLEEENKDFSGRFGIIEKMHVPYMLKPDMPFEIKEFKPPEWERLVEAMKKNDNCVKGDVIFIDCSQMAAEFFDPIKQSVHRNIAIFQFYADNQFKKTKYQMVEALDRFMFREFAKRVNDGKSEPGIARIWQSFLTQ